MIDLARTLFRLSFHDGSEIENLISDNSLTCEEIDVVSTVNSITSNVYVNHTSPRDSSGLESTGSHIFPSVKFHTLEDLDVESIREKQAEFLKTLHHMHISE